MTRNRVLYFLFICFAFSNLIISQNEEKIRFKKDPGLIYFFQKGKKSDTLQKGQGDVFYLIVPDSLKPFLSIQVDNAQLLLTDNDSLVKLNYVKGFNYESIYLTAENHSQKNGDAKRVEFKTLVNGVSAIDPNHIEIKFIDKREKNVLLRNVFYYYSKN